MDHYQITHVLDSSTISNDVKSARDKCMGGDMYALNVLLATYPNNKYVRSMVESILSEKRQKDARDAEDKRRQNEQCC